MPASYQPTIHGPGPTRRAGVRLGYLILAVHAIAALGCESDQFSAAQAARAADLAALVERDRLRDHVYALVETRMSEEGELPPWGEGKPLLRTAARSYLLDQFRALGMAPVEEQEVVNGTESVNIVVDIPGVVRPDEFVIISAHYDTWYLGADDNASGLAVLLEAARVFAQAPPPARTIRLLAFDREEEGLIGSRRYVAKHRGDRVAMVINLDTVGYSDSTPGSQMSIPALTAPDTGDFLAVLSSSDSRSALLRVAALSNELPRPVFVLGVVAPGDSRYPGTGDLLRSDHAWFWNQGIPGLFFTDTANFRNPHYHESTDLPDTLNYDFLHGVAGLTIGAAAAFAEVR